MTTDTRAARCGWCTRCSPSPRFLLRPAARAVRSGRRESVALGEFMESDGDPISGAGQGQRAVRQPPQGGEHDGAQLGLLHADGPGGPLSRDLHPAADHDLCQDDGAEMEVLRVARMPIRSGMAASPRRCSGPSTVGMASSEGSGRWRGAGRPGPGASGASRRSTAAPWRNSSTRLRMSVVSARRTHRTRPTPW